MFLALLASVTALILTAFTQAAYLNMDNTARMQRELAAEAVAEVAATVRRFKSLTGDYPASLNTLANTAGFTHLKPLLAAVGDNALGYVVSTAPISDGVWQFNRAAVFTVKVQAGETAADYASANQCGTGAATAASSWCGSADSFWWRAESRERNVTDLIGERLRQHRLIKKFTEAYNARTDGMFPDVGAQYAQLSTLAGYAGTAISCTGTFSWNGIPLDCDDLFSAFGTPTVINQITRRHIALLAESSITDASGNKINVATDMYLE